MPITISKCEWGYTTVLHECKHCGIKVRDLADRIDVEWWGDEECGCHRGDEEWLFIVSVVSELKRNGLFVNVAKVAIYVRIGEEEWSFKNLLNCIVKEELLLMNIICIGIISD